MIIQIHHETTYRYSQAVFLEPHVIRLTPRGSGVQQVMAYEMKLDPEPAGLCFGLDAHGNSFAYAWFTGTTDRLTINVHTTVRTMRDNPFDFYFDNDKDALPMHYPPAVQEVLEAYRVDDADAKLSPALQAFVQPILEETEHRATPFLPALSLAINQHTKTTIRDKGEPMQPDQTFEQASGACRDQAVLFVHICRSLGLAARFVSGYQEGDPDPDRRDLHAWAEVYLPGIGWRGYDPTLGIACADRHVPVAAGPTPADASPVSAHFRGTGATSSLETHIELQLMPEPQQMQVQTESSQRQTNTAASSAEVQQQ